MKLLDLCNHLEWMASGQVEDGGWWGLGNVCWQTSHDGEDIRELLLVVLVLVLVLLVMADCWPGIVS